MRIALLVGLAVAAQAGPGQGCSTQAPPTEAATLWQPCSTDRDCDDERFCNGVERCAQDQEGRGTCVAGTGPCPNSTCDERALRCTADMTPPPDAGPGCTSGDPCDCDGDGVRSAMPVCDGTDCDDRDIHSFPGNREQCDGLLPDGRAAADHDEDCNPCTVGGAQPDGDLDRDGFVSALCTNAFVAFPSCDTFRVTVGMDGSTVAGADCDPGNPSVHPAQVEACNGVDDNCNAQVDEGARVPLHVDADRDGQGAGPAVDACAGAEGFSAVDGDCDDNDALVFRGVQQCLPGDAFSVRVCDGTWVTRACVQGTSCRPQPNGTGVCL